MLDNPLASVRPLDRAERKTVSDATRETNKWRMDLAPGLIVEMGRISSRGHDEDGRVTWDAGIIFTFKSCT